MQTLANPTPRLTINATPPVTGFDPERIMVEATDHHRAGRYVQAETLYRKVTGADPGHPVAHYNFGLLCHTQARLPEAIRAYQLAIDSKPDYADAYINLGTIIMAQGDHEEAAALFRQAIAIRPDNAMAYVNLGKALQDSGRLEDAVTAYRDAIARQSDNGVAHANLGGALLEQQAWEESVAFTRRAIELKPDNALAHANLGTALMNLGRHQEALRACRQAIALRPQGAVIHATLGGALLELGAWEEAEALCRHATILDPTLPNGFFNLSHVLKATNKLDEAAAAVRQAIVLRPDNADYHFHLAHILLSQGEFDAGWAEYEWRWKLPDFAWLNALQGIELRPRWTGEDISDKTILVYTEQGIGDIIQFARYLPLLVQKARQVLVAANPPLRRLLSSIAGITIVPMHEHPLPSFDVHCPLMSLPRAFHTQVDSIPANVPYLAAAAGDRERWGRRLSGDALRVGIVWAGNPATKRDRYRSPGLPALAPLFSVPGVDFVVLQVGPGRDDLKDFPLPSNVLDLGAEVSDLADTAAIMSGLDLMISSCTGPLHLAGALGVPCWAMIPFAPYFTWLLNRGDSPWYPSVQLRRQDRPGQDWSSVVNRMAGDLTALAKARKNTRTPSHLAANQPGTVAPVNGPCMIKTVNNFTVLESIYGKFVVNRHCAFQADVLVKTGHTHIEAELAKILTVVRSLDDGCVIVDAGANIGLVSVPIAQEIKQRRGIVHAFEVQRMLFYALCGSAALNDLDNIFVHNKALGASAGEVNAGQPDYARPQDFGLYSLNEPINDAPQEKVPLVTIDSLNLPRLDFLKIDVEGMEPEVLRGATNAIEAFSPWCWVEYWKVDISAIKAAFPAGKYRFYLMDQLNLLCAPLCRTANAGIRIDGDAV
jgi:FkbM family methyltransferase